MVYGIAYIAGAYESHVHCAVMLVSEVSCCDTC